MNDEKVASAVHADMADVVLPLPGHVLPRRLTFVLVVAAVAGTIAAVAAVGAFVPARESRDAASAAEKAAIDAALGAERASIINQRLILDSARLLAAVEHNQEVMLRNQDCTKALLLILPEERTRLPVAEVDRLCPSTQRFVATTTTTTTTLRRTATTRPRRTTTTRRRRATTTTRPSTTTTTTTRPSSPTPSPPPTTCITLPSPAPGVPGVCR